MNQIGIFPFGQPIIPVAQAEKTPKNIFVLGVYASAVHARWIGPDGKRLVTALAVAVPSINSIWASMRDDESIPFLVETLSDRSIIRQPFHSVLNLSSALL